MRRRAFFTAFGLGTAATVATGVAAAKSARSSEKRDLQWAKARAKEGHRVRLETWRVPVNERPAFPTDASAALMVRMGSPAGLVSLDECAVTVEMLEGPWEIVPKEDYPKPPQPSPWVGQGGQVTITGGGGGAHMLFTAGEG